MVDWDSNVATTRGGQTPTLTLFCGLPGAGKTTLARRLEAGGTGVRICTDDWQAELGQPHADAEFHGRFQVVLYRHALDLLRHGTDVILEDGLWLRDERTKKFCDARTCGARIDLHVFDVSLDTLWSRLQGPQRKRGVRRVSDDVRRAQVGLVAVPTSDGRRTCQRGSLRDP